MKKVLIIIIVSFVIIAIGITVFFLIRLSQEETVPIDQPMDQTISESTEPQETVDEPMRPNPYENDHDGDGISNEEEDALGTNSEEFDTDADGLSDALEIKVTGSDPLNPDTDGDGFSDGVEVLNGYNPLGDGDYVPLVQGDPLIEENK